MRIEMEVFDEQYMNHTFNNVQHQHGNIEVNQHELFSRSLYRNNEQLSINSI